MDFSNKKLWSDKHIAISEEFKELIAEISPEMKDVMSTNLSVFVREELKEMTRRRQEYKENLLTEADILGKEPLCAIDSFSAYAHSGAMGAKPNLTLANVKNRTLKQSDIELYSFPLPAFLQGIGEGLKKAQPLNKRKAQRKARRVNRK